MKGIRRALPLLLALSLTLLPACASKNVDADTSEQPTDTVTEETTGTETVIVGRNTGRILSDTGTKLNLFLEWDAARRSDGTALLTVRVGLEYYSLSVGARSGEYCGVLTVNGNSRTFETPAISNDTNKPHTTVFAEEQFVFPLSGSGAQSFPVAAEWYYNGSYHGVRIVTIRASGEAVVPAFN